MEASSVSVAALVRATERPQDFLSASKHAADVAKRALLAAQELFNQAVRDQTRALGPLDTLHVDGFDDEQIWAELELRNEPVVAYVRRALERPQELHVPDVAVPDDDMADAATDDMADDDDDGDDDDDDMAIDHDDDDDDDDDDDAEEAEQSDEDSLGGSDDDGMEDEDEDADSDVAVPDEGDEEEDDEDTAAGSKRGRKRAASDDLFFDMDEMEQFVAEGEREMAAGRTMLYKEPKEGADDEDDDDEEEDSEEDVDIYEDLPSDEEDDEAGPKYRDFFGEDAGRLRDAASDDDDEAMEGDDDDDDDEATEAFMGRRHERKNMFAEDDDENAAGLSRHERERRQAERRMRAMEEENLEARSWLLNGEAGARSRPENSLLEEDLEFDHTRKNAPLITAETTLSLEEIIKKRIKDGLFDDVERRVPENLDLPFKPRVELEEEKSKQSLSEIYERAYLEQTKQLQEDSPAEKARQRIKGLMSELFVRLDALANAHFVPKKAEVEVQVLTNVPALVAEEVAPAASAGATMRLAPEEVFDKPKSVPVGDSERTQAERRRLRAARKAANKREREREKKDAARVERMNPGLGNKYSKKAALEELQRGAKAGRVTVVGAKGTPTDTTKYGSSAAVFAKMQDNARTGAGAEKKRPRIAAPTDGTRLKL